MQLFRNFISAISQIIRQPEQTSLSMAPFPCRTTQHVSEMTPVDGAEVTERALKMLTCHGSTRHCHDAGH